MKLAWAVGVILALAVVGGLLVIFAQRGRRPIAVTSSVGWLPGLAAVGAGLIAGVGGGRATVPASRTGQATGFGPNEYQQAGGYFGGAKQTESVSGYVTGSTDRLDKPTAGSWQGDYDKGASLVGSGGSWGSGGSVFNTGPVGNDNAGNGLDFQLSKGGGAGGILGSDY